MKEAMEFGDLGEEVLVTSGEERREMSRGLSMVNSDLRFMGEETILDG